MNYKNNASELEYSITNLRGRFLINNSAMKHSVISWLTFKLQFAAENEFVYRI